jgi:hypothetical protein
MANQSVSEAIAEMVTVIDAFAIGAALAFIDGETADLTHVFPKNAGEHSLFPPWFERWLAVCYPDSAEYQRRIDGDVATKDDYLDLTYDVSRFSFLLGYLMCARSMGASPTELIRLARGWRFET